MKISVQKAAFWADMTNSDPLGDVRSLVSEDPFSNITLYLSSQSVRALFQHPDTCAVPRRDWKYLFQVDDVQVSADGTDFLRFKQ